ncbi:MAG: prepilin-type N-terminal cleavage/methylation domain-containing protein [Moraxella equi]|nr:prepilin-type N-terminal cleavage/methylation domain-containing protein [Moraxella equi]
MFHSNLYSYSRQSGFTLVEMIITIAVMGVIAAIAYPGLQSQIAKARVAQTAGDIESALKEARAEALIKRTNITVQLSNNQMLSATGLNNQSVIKPVKVPKNVTITPLGNTPTTIVFTANKVVKNGANSSNLNANNGFVVCYHGSRTVKSILIDPTANIRVVSNQGSCT